MNQPNPIKNKNSIYIKAEDMILNNYSEKPYRLTPLIVTFSFTHAFIIKRCRILSRCWRAGAGLETAFIKQSTFPEVPGEGIFTHIDMQKLMEMNLHIVRFRMTYVTKKDKLNLLAMLKQAQQLVCEKYEVNKWPVAICLDIPNAVIRSGYIDDECKTVVLLDKGAIVTISSDVKYFKKMNSSTIFIDDPYTIQTIRPGAIITICVSGIKFICVHTIDKNNIKCEVIRGGILGSNQFVGVLGIKHQKPPLLKYDMELLDFAKEFKFDVITVFSVRYAKTIEKIKMYLGKNYEPLILSSICDQEGLDNIDEIIKVSDGIILARELLTHQLINRHSLSAIQLNICAKCKREGKTCFLSGNILEQTLTDGSISACDLSDITNAALQGAGFVIRQFNDAKNALEAMALIDSVCKCVESSEKDDGFWRLIQENRMPIDAAEGCILACAIMARQVQSLVVIIVTKTGRTAIQLSRMAPFAIIITVSRDPRVARKLQMYRGIYAVIYEKKPKPDWYQETEARIQFAVSYGIKMDLLSYGNLYITFRKTGPTSCFCDNISCWTVTSHEARSFRICESYALEESTEDLKVDERYLE